MGEVLTHEGHICGFDGHVTAHGTHGDADLSSGQRRRIVDAVAHHGGGSSCSQPFNGSDLVLWEQLGADRVDHGGLATGLRGAAVFAGELLNGGDSKRTATANNN